MSKLLRKQKNEVEHPIKSYQYWPHSTIPQALADFVAGQGRDIQQATRLDIHLPGEGLNEWQKESEQQFAYRCKVAWEDIRRFLVEFADGIGYQGYLALIDRDCWYVCWVEMTLTIKLIG